MCLKRLLITGIVCLVAAPALAQVTYFDFSSTAGLTLNGSTVSANNGIDPAPVLRLVPAAFAQRGSASTSGRVCLGGFSSFFRFRITNAGPPGTPDALGQIGADGLTLMFQRGSNTALGGWGGSLGYEGLPASVAVELDTWFNGGSYADPDSNHVGIDINGSMHSLAAQPVPGRFDDGNLWSVWVDYDGAVLEVRVSNSPVRPAAPTVALAIDIPATLGSSTGFVGFGAGTGAAFGNHDVVSWTFDEQCTNLVVAGCDSGVPDHRLASGVLFSERLQACAVGATTHGGWASCVGTVGTESMKARSITGRQRGAIQSCAARAPYYTGPVRAGEFIVNGGFETGDTTGWTLFTTGVAAWSINDGTLDPDGPATALPPIDGNFDLVSHQLTVHLNRAIQVLTVPLEVHAATLRWSDRLRSSGALADPGQEYRVMIRALDLTPILEVFSTSAADPPVQLGPNVRSADLAAALQALKGQTVVISFEHQVDSFFFALTLDQVSLAMTYR